MVAALGILVLLTVTGCGGSAHAAQAGISIASSTTQAVPASAPASFMTVKAVQAAAQPVATWTVRPGDTLSGIATALSVRGGWQELYAANRRLIGPDPGLIRPGTILTLPGRPTTARYAVAPGDTLSAIAAALGVRGGWQALYAANRRVIGPDPGLIRPGTVLTVPGRQAPLRYTVAPGDTLSGIAAALGARGGWPALYAANRRVIGPDPNVIRPGTVLAAVPATTAPAATGPSGPAAPASPGTP